jgi:aspartate/glutamate racemase
LFTKKTLSTSRQKREKSLLENVSNCIISSILSTESATILKNIQENKAEQTLASEQKADTKVEATSDIVKSNTSTSYLDIIANNITLVIIIIGVLITVGVIAFGLPIIKGIFGKKS